MKQIRILIIAAFTLFIEFNSIHADELYYTVKMNSDPKKNSVEITPEGVYNPVNIPPVIAEYTLSNGKIIKAKLGEGPTRPYGFRGGVPDLWLSVWVDKVKVLNRIPFSCEYEGPTGLRITVNNKGISICRKDTNPENEESDPKESCETTPYSKLPKEIDRIEYPQKGDKIPPKPGEVVEIYSKDKKICDCFQKKISENNFSNESSFLEEKSRFDFDNDGKDEDVIWYSAETHYRDGAVIFISRTGSLPKVTATKPLTGDRLYEYGQKADRVFPHHWAAINKGLEDEFNDLDNGGTYSFKQKYSLWWEPQNVFNGSSVRYMRLKSERLDNKTYLIMDSVESGNEGWYAILKPEPDDSVTEMCIFKRVSEHY